MIAIVLFSYSAFLYMCDPEARMRERVIYIIAPGGTAARGGMGRMVANLTGRLTMRREFPIVVIHPYGPKVNGAHAGWMMPFYFVAAAMRLLSACLGQRVGLAHSPLAVG